MIHEGKSSEPRIVLEGAASWLMEFQAFQRAALTDKVSPSITSRQWKTPIGSHLKLNVDASVSPNFAFIVLGGLIRNSAGVVLGAFSKKICLALREDLLFARDSGLWVKDVEMDSSEAAECIDNSGILSEIGTVVDDIKSLMVEARGGQWCFVSRKCNKAAHTPAYFALSLDSERFWLEETLDCIADGVHADLAND